MGEGRGIVFAEEARTMFELAQDVGVWGAAFASRGRRGCGSDMSNDFFWKGHVVVRKRRVDEEEASDLDPAAEKLARGFVGDNTTEGPAWRRC